MKILVVGGHPADIFDHCGGTMYHHVQQGDEVVGVSITQGLRVHDEVIYDIFRHKANDYTQEELDKIIEERQQARKNRDFATADAIRDKLLAMGIILEDTREGVKWKKA